MRCLINNCLHTVRVSSHKSPSWNIYQICPCCAFELYRFNLSDRDFWKFKCKSYKRCMLRTTNREYKKPMSNYVMEILLVRPSSTIELRDILNEAFNLKTTAVKLGSILSDMRDQELVYRIGCINYPVKNVLLKVKP